MGQFSSYWLYERFEQRGSQEPIPVYPNIYSINGDGTMPLVVRNEDDTECGYVPPVEPTYRWTNIPITQDYICDECNVAQYRWVNMDASVDYYCEGTTKYYKQKKQVSYDDGQTWQDVIPPEYQKGGVAEAQSTDCGYVPPQYRWVNMDSSVDYYCEGTTKYYKQKKQVSYDDGQTWQDVTPPEYQKGGVAETQSTDCGYVPPTPTTKDYFRLEENSTNGGSIQLVGAPGAYQYSTNSGDTWVNANANTVIPTTYGQVTMFKGNLRPDENNSLAGIGTFSFGGSMTARGNTMSLLFGDNFEDKTSLEGIDYAFARLFKGSTLNNPLNELPATTLSEDCYYEMYADCTYLAEVGVPSLPATTLSTGCYQRMFSGCTSIKVIPNLPATTLASFCYEGMFAGCTSLGIYRSSIGELHINLPATNLGNAFGCYQYMFGGCTNLKDENLANPLPATRLTRYCYQTMFQGCTSLVNIPSNFIAATSPGDAAMRGMFQGCTSLKRAPDILCSSATDWCFVRMFKGCSSLNYIKCLVKNGTSGPSYMPYQDFEEWMDGVSSTGTFVTPSDASWYNGIHGIPTGWTRVNA